LPERPVSAILLATNVLLVCGAIWWTMRQKKRPADPNSGEADEKRQFLSDEP
jgi:hypothetical protein